MFVGLWALVYVPVFVCVCVCVCVCILVLAFECVLVCSEAWV